MVRSGTIQLPWHSKRYDRYDTVPVPFSSDCCVRYLQRPVFYWWLFLIFDISLAIAYLLGNFYILFYITLAIVYLSPVEVSDLPVHSVCMFTQHKFRNAVLALITELSVVGIWTDRDVMPESSSLYTWKLNDTTVTKLSVLLYL